MLHPPSKTFLPDDRHDFFHMVCARRVISITIQEDLLLLLYFLMRTLSYITALNEDNVSSTLKYSLVLVFRTRKMTGYLNSAMKAVSSLFFRSSFFQESCSRHRSPGGPDKRYWRRYHVNYSLEALLIPDLFAWLSIVDVRQNTAVFLLLFFFVFLSFRCLYALLRPLVTSRALQSPNICFKLFLLRIPRSIGIPESSSLCAAFIFARLLFLCRSDGPYNGAGS